MLAGTAGGRGRGYLVQLLAPERFLPQPKGAKPAGGAGRGGGRGGGRGESALGGGGHGDWGVHAHN